MDPRILRSYGGIIRQTYGGGGVMTTASGGYVTEMPAAAAAAAAAAASAAAGTSSSPTSSSPSPSENGTSTRTSTTSSSSHSTPVNSVTSITVTNSSPSPLLTIVSNVQGSPTRAGSASPSGSVGEVSMSGMGVTTTHITAQVVGTTSGTSSSTTSPTVSLPKGTIIADSHIIINAESNASRSYTSLTPVNPSLASEGDGSLDSSGGVGVPGAYVQAYPVYTVGDTTMYTATTYYQPGSTTPVSYSQEVANSPVSGQILTSGGSPYVIQPGVDGEAHPLLSTTRASPQTDEGVTYMVSGNTPALDADAQANLAHATRVSPATVSETVQWLLDNYETADGVSLPRSTLYNHYLRHCADHKLDPVNAASFGKLIRSVFLGLRTRRLGTRGNSKYHYYGIRLKPSSPLVNISDDGSPVSLRQQASGNQIKKNQTLTQQSQQQQQSPGTHSQQGKSVSSSVQKQNSDSHYDSHTQAPAEASPQTLQQQQYLGDISLAVPMLGEVDFGSTPLPAGVTRPHLHTFTVLYREHCETILEAVYNLQFSAVEGLWRRFWMISNNNNVAVEAKSSSSEISDDDEGDLASLLPSSVLQALLRSPPVLEFVRSFDYQFYQNLVEVLIPDVLRSIPSSLTQAIRNFAKSLEAWLSNAMLGCPPDIVNIKVSAVSSFAQTLRRYTSLNHLAQAARAVLQNSSQISQMLADLNRVDFHNVQEQASWVCQCDSELVERLEEDFKATLQQQNSLEQWAEWLQAVVSQVLRPHEGKPDFPKQARQFLLKWSFYSSMVIRDLTLRSAASFGSFHLIRLLYDEYMFYLVEHKVASSLGLTPIAVISQVLGGGNYIVVNGESEANHRSDGVHQSVKRLKYEAS
ncbi:DNA-binding protein RFX2-like isoform X2 [Macrobrachium rosenbergii]|uniref:DNA-binding protein RFX2-like isoform X2 n=1 Tax=Macrobrachium rosenbergii TaxID=79674 RepID=UPI0034D7AAFB